MCVFFFQAEDGIRDLVRSRGLGDVYKRQAEPSARHLAPAFGKAGIADGAKLSSIPIGRVLTLSLIHI